MINRQKILIFLLVIVVIVGAIVIAQISKNQKNSMFETIQLFTAPEKQDSQAVQIDQETQEQQIIKQQVLPKEFRGKIVGMSPTSLIIDQESGALTVQFDINTTPIFKGEKKEKTSALDLKSGVEVMVNIDENTKAATEIVIQ